MKLLISATLILLSFNLFSASEKWQLVSESTDTLSAPKDIFAYLSEEQFGDQKFKAYAQNYQLSFGESLTVTQIAVKTITIKWIGESVCGADDSRRLEKTESVTATFSNGEQVTHNDIVVDLDPCLLGVDENIQFD